MRIALHRAGFENLLFSRTVGPDGVRFFVEANCSYRARFAGRSCRHDLLRTRATSC
jgi:hypothetical protein